MGDGWNDYSCTESLPFVCEKKGDNYVPPPGPDPPKPACPEGWVSLLEKCVYNSYSFGELGSTSKCRFLTLIWE